MVRILRVLTHISDTVFISIFLATQLFIFGFTDQGIWADTYTAINRLPLHFTPAVIFAALTLLHSRFAPVGGPGVPANPLGPSTAPSVAQPLLASLVAALIVTAGSMAFLAHGLPENSAEVREYAAADFKFMAGSGSADGDHVVVDGFAEGYALLSSGQIELPAANYRFLRLTLESHGSDGVPVFFWRSAGAPGKLTQAPVPESGPVLIDLSARDGWQGEISEFGFLFEERGGIFAMHLLEGRRGEPAIEREELIERHEP